MMSEEIREFISILTCKTLQHIIDRSHEQDIELELRNMWKPHRFRQQWVHRRILGLMILDLESNRVEDFLVSVESRTRGSVVWVVRAASSAVRQDTLAQLADWILGYCTSTTIQVIHKKADFPSLIGGAMRTPSLATLRITDGCQGKNEAPMVKSIVFQLTTEEGRVVPNVVTNMYSYLFIAISLLILMLVHDVIRDDPMQWYACSRSF